MDSSGGALLGLWLIGMGLIVYLLPAIIALGRHHRQAAPIVILDVFLGWSLVGWVIALAWAASAQPAAPKAGAALSSRPPVQ